MNLTIKKTYKKFLWETPILIWILDKERRHGFRIMAWTMVSAPSHWTIWCEVGYLTKYLLVMAFLRLNLIINLKN
jgi:hypothetical protein